MYIFTFHTTIILFHYKFNFLIIIIIIIILFLQKLNYDNLYNLLKKNEETINNQ